VRASRLLTPLLAGATVLLAVSNVVPATARKHALAERRQVLLRKLEAEREREQRLHAELEALRTDAFVLERLLCETWNLAPPGALAAPLPLLSSE